MRYQQTPRQQPPRQQGPRQQPPVPRQQSPLPPTRPVGPPTAVTPSGATTPQTEEKAKAPDLTINKLIAGAGAAATSAVFGSYFGAAGTVTGAALGSVVTTLGSTLYQRSLDRTRDTVKAKIKLPSGRNVEVTRDAATGLDSAAQLTMPMPRVSSEGHPIGSHPPRPATGGRTRQVAPALDSVRRLPPRRIAILSGVTVLIFALGLLVVTGVEWAKGSPLSGGDSGTSVSRVLNRSANTSGTGHTENKGTEPARSTETTQAPTSAEPSATATPTPTSSPESSAANATRNPSASQIPTPTQRNGSTGSARNEAPAPTSGALLPGIGG